MRRLEGAVGGSVMVVRIQARSRSCRLSTSCEVKSSCGGPGSCPAKLPRSEFTNSEGNNERTLVLFVQLPSDVINDLITDVMGLITKVEGVRSPDMNGTPNTMVLDDKMEARRAGEPRNPFETRYNSKLSVVYAKIPKPHFSQNQKPTFTLSDANSAEYFSCPLKIGPNNQ